MENAYPFDRSGTFEIRIAGKLDPSWSEWLGGMAISAQPGERSGEWVTVLNGWLPDQAALNGVLNALYNNRFAILHIDVLELNNATRCQATE